MKDQDTKCDGCGNVVYSYRVVDGKRFGHECCAVSGPVPTNATLHQYRLVAGHRMSEIEVRRIRSRRLAPDGTAPTLKRYARKGDQVR